MSLLPMHTSSSTPKQKQPQGIGPKPPTPNHANAASQTVGLTPGTGLKFQIPPSQGHTANFQANQASEPVSTKCYIVDPPQEYDESGAELGRDAQVWKAYVKESDESDGERVDGWNKTLDVLLIFAALFSAISTAFVLESYQDLKEDPAEVSAETLRLISQTLLLMANGTQITLPPASLQTEPAEFQPSLSAILVNGLWFLSLTLSVSVSLVAMLAKEWCFTFMSGRTGSPASQARRRQQRWEGLNRWGMENMVMFLPSVIQLALLLFAVGLSIFLWDIHLGVAIPVAVSAGIAAILYGICTILPFFDKYCPYGTTLTKICTMLLRINLQSTPDELQQDKVTSQALHWIITNCETPRSVDVALQSVAGATNQLPVDLLESCGSSALIRHRFMAADTLRVNPDQSLLLYSRALLFLEGEMQSRRLMSSGQNGQLDCRLDLASRSESSRLEVLLWTIQFKIDSCLSNSKHDTTKIPWCEEVLDICQIFTLQGAKMLRYGHPRPQTGRRHDLFLESWGDQLNVDPTILKKAVTLLMSHFLRRVDIPSHIVESRESGFELSHIIFSMLLICGLVHDTSTIAKEKLPMQFMHNNQMDRDMLGIILTAFALSRQDYPGWIHPTPLTRATRVERAVDFLLHDEIYSIMDGVKFLLQPDRGTIKIGVLHLMSFPESYGLDNVDLEVLTTELAQVDPNGEVNIPTLPPSFNPCSKVMSDVTSEIEKNKFEFLLPGRNGGNLVPIQSCLQVLCHTYNREITGVPTDAVYVFALTCACRHVKSEEPAMVLFEAFPFPVLSDNLADLIVSYSTVGLLEEVLEDDDMKLQLLARSQLWLLTTLLLRSGSTSDDRYQPQSRLRARLLKDDPVINKRPEDNAQLLERAQRHHSAQFAQVFRGYTGNHAAYFRRVLFCMLLAEKSLDSDDRWEIVGGFQSDDTSRDFEYLLMPVEG